MPIPQLYGHSAMSADEASRESLALSHVSTAAGSDRDREEKRENRSFSIS